MACHLTAGRQDKAESLLVATFGSLRRALHGGEDIVNADDWLPLGTHRLHLDGMCIDADGFDTGADDCDNAIDVGAWAGPLDVAAIGWLATRPADSTSTGPYNRPATSIRLTNTRYGVEPQLSTGSFFVPADCSGPSGWDTATVISYGDPIGAPIDSAGQRFIGDPNGAVPKQVAPLLPSVQLPADSNDSGIRIEGAPLFTSSSVLEAVFVVTDHCVQRWPVFTPPPYCDGIRS